MIKKEQCGPLTVAAVLALTDNDYGPALGILALPGVAALALPVWLRFRVPDPARYEPRHPDTTHPKTQPSGTQRSHPATLPPAFWMYCAFTATTMIGFATFGVLSFHMVTRGAWGTARLNRHAHARHRRCHSRRILLGHLRDRCG